MYYCVDNNIRTLIGHIADSSVTKSVAQRFSAVLNGFNGFRHFGGFVLRYDSPVSSISSSCGTTHIGSMILELSWYLTNMPRWHFFAIFLGGYLVYYLVEVVKVSFITQSYDGYCDLSA